MTDIVDSQTRSRMMSGIRGRNTKLELALRRSLHALGLRYRLHEKGIPGKPDIVMSKCRAVIFVHGCFWHRHAGCRYATVGFVDRKRKAGTRFRIAPIRQVRFERPIVRTDVEKAGASYRYALVTACRTPSATAR